MTPTKNEGLGLLDILAFLVRWRRIWLPTTLTCALAVGIYSFVATPLYRSSAVVRGIENKGSGLGSLIASKLSGLGNLAGFAPALGEVRGDYYLLLLRAPTMNKRVIEEFDLRTRLKMPDEPIEDVLEAWKSRVYFKYESNTNTVMVQVDDPDADVARRIVEFYIAELDRRNRELESTKARKEREFSANRLVEARATLYALEDSMAQFQRTSGIFDLEEQAKATVQAVAAVQAERLMAQAEYEFKAKLFSGDNPELNIARMKLAGIDSSISTLMSPQAAGLEHDFLLRLDSATEDGKTYLRLYRDIEVNSLLMIMLTQQYESARLEEARNTPTMAVVEPASVATRRSWPKRGLLVGLGAAAGMLIGLFGAGVMQAKLALSSPEHPSYPALQRLSRSWSGR